MECIAIAKDGGLFIPNINQFGYFLPNETLIVDIISITPYIKRDDKGELPFETLPNRGAVITDKLVNKIREEEGI